MIDELYMMMLPKAFLHSRRGRYLLGKWATKVKRRDEYTCARCKKNKSDGVVLHAHHVYPKAMYPKMAFRIDNGVTLCSYCHTLGRNSYHSTYGVNGSRSMFLRWLQRKY